MIVLWAVIATVGIAACAGIVFLARKRNVHLWLPSYVKGNWAGRRERGTLDPSRTVHIMFCIADHFEPGWGNPEIEEERRRIDHWLTHYPQFAAGHQDADGCPPRQTLFFPAEEYRRPLCWRWDRWRWTGWKYRYQSKRWRARKLLSYSLHPLPKYRLYSSRHSIW